MSSDEGAAIAEEKETLARSQLPYKVEYCKTSRAKCKKCIEPMLANTVKMAVMTKSRWHDGYDPTYYHIKCFFQIKRPTSVAEVGHFEILKFEDQKLIEEAIETNGRSVLGAEIKLEKGGKKGSTDNDKSKKSKAKKRQPVESSGFLVNYDDFLADYAKSNRSKCIKCSEKIDKDAVRLGKLDYAAETQWTNGPLPRWYHVECFIASMEKLEFFGHIEKIKNFGDLKEEDRKLLKKKVKPIQPPNNNTGDSGEKKIKKVDDEEERLLKKQSDRFFALREFVNTMKRKDIELMLSSMRQKANYKAPAMLIDAATDVLLFGALERCPKCKKSGGMMLRGSSYICSINHDSECDYETRDPERHVPEIPDEIVEKYPYLSDTYEFIGGKRLFSSKLLKAIEQKEAEDNKVVLKGAPLDGISFGVISWKGVDNDKIKVEKKVLTLGGKIHTALDSSLFVILTSEDELSKNHPKVEVAKELKVPFASADFLFKIEDKNDVVRELKRSLIGKWKGDLEERFNRMSSRNGEIKKDPDRAGHSQST